MFDLKRGSCLFQPGFQSGSGCYSFPAAPKNGAPARAKKNRRAMVKPTLTRCNDIDTPTKAKISSAYQENGSARVHGAATVAARAFNMILLAAARATSGSTSEKFGTEQHAASAPVTRMCLATPRRCTLSGSRRPKNIRGRTGRRRLRVLKGLRRWAALRPDAPLHRARGGIERTAKCRGARPAASSEQRCGPCGAAL